MKTEEEIRERLKRVEFFMDEFFNEMQDFRIWNSFVSIYWLLKWVLGEADSPFTTKDDEEKTNE